jgi:acyl carrier protein
MSDAAITAPPTSWPALGDPTQLDRIIDIIAQEGSVDREKITPDATLETVGLASMDVVMILMGVEEKLGVYIPMDADLASARNLSEFVAAIAKAMQTSGAPVEVAKTN